MHPRSDVARPATVAAAAAAAALLVQLALPRATSATSEALARPVGPQGHRSVADRRPLPPVTALTLGPIPPFAALDARALFGTLALGPQAQPDMLALVGIAQEGRAALAIVRDSLGVTHVVRVGDSVTGWTVVALAGERLELARGAERRLLALGEPNPAAGPTSR